ncbi:MSHA biogenesis protein MshH [Achromobacter xylosoxidans]
MNRALACHFCLSTLAQGAPLLERNGSAICRSCADAFSAEFTERAWAMASSLDEQLDVLLIESKRALEQSATLAERARGCGLSLADLSVMPPRTLS